jgi:hypothetical protein
MREMGKSLDSEICMALGLDPDFVEKIDIIVKMKPVIRQIDLTIQIEENNDSN